MGVSVDEIHVSEFMHATCTRMWTSEERSDKPGSATVFDFHSGKDLARPEAKDFIDNASRALLVRDVK
jgi:hypothetical protein